MGRRQGSKHSKHGINYYDTNQKNPFNTEFFIADRLRAKGYNVQKDSFGYKVVFEDGSYMYLDTKFTVKI